MDQNSGPAHGGTATAAGATDDEEEAARTRAALAELSEKVVQLTKVIVFLHTRSDGHDARCAALKTDCEGEVQQVASAAAALVESERLNLSRASAQREALLAAQESKHKEAQDSAINALIQFKKAAASREVVCRKKLGEADEARGATIAAMRSRIGNSKSKLDAAVNRAHSDRSWLERQLAGEAAQERLRMDEDFEAESAALKSEHAVVTEELRAARAVATDALREENREQRSTILLEADQETSAAIDRQGDSVEVESRGLEEQVAEAREQLVEARASAAASKDHCALQQREMDTMSREFQEKKRRAHVLSIEADRAHERKLRAEAEMRELRRQKAGIEKLLSGAGVAPETERALAGFTEDVRSAQARFQALRGELSRTQRLVEERRNIMEERGQRATRLAQELLEERRRADELQRVLLRLEQSS